MPRKTELTIDVGVRMHVSDETARMAMQLVDAWLNEDFRRRMLLECKHEDGTVKHILTSTNEERQKAVRA